MVNTWYRARTQTHTRPQSFADGKGYSKSQCWLQSNFTHLKSRRFVYRSLLSVWSVHYPSLKARLVPRCKSSLRLSEISVCERATRSQPLQVTRAVICSVTVIGKPTQSAWIPHRPQIRIEGGIRDVEICYLRERIEDMYNVSLTFSEKCQNVSENVLKIYYTWNHI